MSIPKHMKALVLESPGHIALREVEVPKPGPGEVLVRVKTATTCGTDLKAYLRGHPQIPMPGPFGHEYSGTVAEVGSGSAFQVGESVMGVHSAPCKLCYWCRCNQENLCESIMSTKVLGTFAEYLLVPERIARLNLFSKPDRLSFDQASLLEPLSCVSQCVLELHKHGIFRQPPSVLILGPGAIGLMFVAAMMHEGAGSVTLAGRNAQRLAVGASLGASIVNYPDVPIFEHRGYDLVIECTGQVDVWESSLSYARRGGTVVLFGGCKSGTTARFDTARVHYDQITLLSPFHFGTTAVTVASQWLAEMNLSALITGHASLEQGPVVFESLKNSEGIKVAFHP